MSRICHRCPCLRNQLFISLFCFVSSRFFFFLLFSFLLVFHLSIYVFLCNLLNLINFLKFFFPHSLLFPSFPYSVSDFFKPFLFIYFCFKETFVSIFLFIFSSFLFFIFNINLSKTLCWRHCLSFTISVYLQRHKHFNTRIHRNTCTYTHTNIYTHMRTYAHVCMWVHS